MEHLVNVRTIHKFERVHRLCESEYRKVKGITSELTIEDYKEMDRIFPHLLLQKRYENEDSYRDPDTNPVYYVVCQSRDKDYVMDENPEVELLKIEESAEDFDEGWIFSDEEEETTDSCICSDEEAEVEENTENDVPEKVEDITSRLTEALDKYSKLRNHGKKTVKNFKDDSSADRMGKYSKFENLSEENLDKNMRNQGKDSDGSDCGADWVTVSFPYDGGMQDM